MALLTTEFSANWNGKLFMDVFNTVRRHDPTKFFIGAQHSIVLKGHAPMGTAEIMAITTFKYKSLNDTLSFIDSGRPVAYSAALMKKFYPDIGFETELDHVVFRYIRRDVEVQAGLILEWWTTKYRENIEEHNIQTTLGL